METEGDEIFDEELADELLADGENLLRPYHRPESERLLAPRNQE